MTCVLIEGRRTWRGGRDDEGYREYYVKHLVECGFGDGPANVMQTPGLPQPGYFWQFDDDIDIWAWCTLYADVAIHEEKEGDKSRFWSIVQKFTTKPLIGSGGGGGGGPGGGGGAGGGGGSPGGGSGGRCNEQQQEDPLLEPPRLSFGFKNDREEATHAITTRYFRDGNLLRTEAASVNLVTKVTTFPKVMNSAFEQIRGSQNEWDVGRGTLRVEQNVANLEYDLCSSFQNTLNEAPWAGMPAESVRLASFSGDRKQHGLCYVYFTRVFDFDIRVRLQPGSTTVYEGDWDRSMADEGSKARQGHWVKVAGQKNPVWELEVLGDGTYPLSTIPSHFQKIQDKAGNMMRSPLNGAGLPAECKYREGPNGALTDTGNQGMVRVRKYGTSDFLQLGL